ncbi:ribonuclease HII [Halomarina oriensis]|uniref:Ribonuclease n=1 Tax=Halomarina oriensis TaxID=671145 RepID=A0A6B0GRM8_9EURY|nr:ribonuclease HII [Halomarina oriensis]MWG36791.1 ribonuclease HII [Halomarina oriensis]
MEFGVDEAGRGPVLGPMVAACVAGPVAALPADVDDSKRVAPDRREEIASALGAHPEFGVGVAHVTPERIDGDEDMNTLTVVAHARAIEDAEATGRGLLDACDADADRFARRVGDRVTAAVEVTAEHGADATNPLVGAASIVAKVDRDAVLAALSARFGDVGSGYPSDPTTRQFLGEYVEEHGVLPSCARASWKTSEDALAAAEQSRLDGF